ncbi:MAG: hypothetical protein NVSMB14_04920 [Isosphaeraceae bacterium]
MIRVCCPICSKSLVIDSLDDLPSFPFCTERCKLIDLGRWLDGAYFLPEKEAPDTLAEELLDEEDE